MNSEKNRRMLFPALILALLLTFSGCAGDQDEDPSIDPVEPSVSSSMLKPSQAPSPSPVTLYYNGLSGEASEEEWPNSRPYAVMLNNYPASLPHKGASDADIIYEALVEPGSTRMMAVFSDFTDIEAVGTVRSMRPYYIELALAFDAIYIHAGGSDQAYTDVNTKNVDNIDGVRGSYGGSVFYRDSYMISAAGYEHSMYTSSERILKHVEDYEIRQEHEEDSYDYGLVFAEGDATPQDGETSDKVVVSYGGEKKSTFSYDDEDKAYYMSQFGATYTDGNTGEAVEFNNLLVLFVKTATLDAVGRRQMELNNTSGDGYFFCGGKYVEITWSHDGTGDAFYYTLADGSDLQLAAGRTYISIVPTGSTIEIS